MLNLKCGESTYRNNLHVQLFVAFGQHQDFKVKSDARPRRDRGETDTESVRQYWRYRTPKQAVTEEMQDSDTAEEGRNLPLCMPWRKQARQRHTQDAQLSWGSMRQKMQQHLPSTTKNAQQFILHVSIYNNDTIWSYMIKEVNTEMTSTVLVYDVHISSPILFSMCNLY